jgi:hypothetical protein
MTPYNLLNIPSARELRRCGYHGKHARMVFAHNREMARCDARAGNWGWVVSDTGIASKTSKGILQTDMRAGWFFHQWSEL